MRRGGCFTAVVNCLGMLITLAILLAVGALAVLWFLPAYAEPVIDALGVQLSPAFEETVEVPTLIAQAVAPTIAPTSTGLVPTWTPAAISTNTPQPTNTRRPTAEPSITSTFPPPTSTPTPSDTPTPTATPTLTATTVTRSPFPFTKSVDSPFYIQNFANDAQCNWLGIGGEVLDLNRNPVLAGSYRVHVWGSGIDQRVVVGTQPQYNPSSGWEVYIQDFPAVRDFNIQLESPEGTGVSQIYLIQTRASCEQNLTYFIFEQNH